MDITWHDQSFTLLPDRAVHWHEAEALVITDPHFGKTDSFRAGGVPVPDGALNRDLDRIDVLLQQARVNRLIILGDFFHNRASRSPGVINTLHLWFEKSALDHVLLIRGNHDHHAGDPPPQWSVDIRRSGCVWQGLSLWHDPADAQAQASPSPGLAGHVHPVVRLYDGRHRIARLPCFYLQPNLITLPAFGSFTGGHPVHPVAARGEQAVATDGEQLMDVTAALNA